MNTVKTYTGLVERTEYAISLSALPGGWNLDARIGSQLVLTHTTDGIRRRRSSPRRPSAPDNAANATTDR